jgi:hypothetical protein
MALSFYQRAALPSLDMLPPVLCGVVLDYLEFPELRAVVAFLWNLNAHRLKLIGGEHQVNDYAKVINDLFGVIKWYLPCDFQFEALDISLMGDRVPEHLALNCQPTVPQTINLEQPFRQLMACNEALPTYDVYGGLLQSFTDLVKDYFKLERRRDSVDEPPAKRANIGTTTRAFRRISAKPPRMSAKAKK